METMVRIAAVGLTAAVLGTVLKKSAPELALLLVVAAGVWILTLTLDGLGAVAALMEELAGVSGLSEELLEPVAKTVALSILTRLTAEICRSAGESGLASFVEVGGTVAALVVALPLMRAVAVLMAEMLT
ncbi:stage III sporulation protein AD [Pseudoflavonifractor sp. AF19-9AC]|uniref:SpoIIIAC/SpoIIIAD family protein n=1 Tax=Pseudoflavonifractor sp. AF19-9AC TaxID=2292244 RepID=UPI000E4D12A6|nr:SpoIIIAC/SpoIIIAD family protein [Pseudoflavonifractor sp. AF19-9AC]RHR05625.1 stage III sporulation protein AD [Pseudoflavonifractor sp. AF19-9AC]